MNIIITQILSLCLLLSSCTNSTSTAGEIKSDKVQVAANDSIEKAALDYLYEKISKLPKVSFKDNEILIGDTTIRLKVNVEFDGQNQDKWVYAAKISTFYKANKETQIDVGSIGIGSNKDEAINVCLEEWFAVFGIPFTNMLNGNKGFSLSNMDVYSGLMGIRGKLPDNTWLQGNDEMSKIIIDQIKEQIKRETAEFIPIDIKIIIGNNGISDGECRIGNKISGPLLESLKQLDWPSSNDVFIFKQFYLIHKTE